MVEPFDKKAPEKVLVDPELYEEEDVDIDGDVEGESSAPEDLLLCLITDILAP